MSRRQSKENSEVTKTEVELGNNHLLPATCTANVWLGRKKGTRPMTQQHDHVVVPYYCHSVRYQLYLIGSFVCSQVQLSRKRTSISS